MKFRDALAVGLRSVRANAVPMVVLWAVAVALVFAYHAVPAVAAALEPISRWQTAGGWGAACKGDGRCISGYRFIYAFAPVTWEQIHEMHEKSIHLVLKELEGEKLAGSAKKGLSVDEEKSRKVRQREFDRFAQSLPERVPRLLEKGSNKVAFDLLRLLADGPRRPAELRAALGISSVNFFTARDLTPLAKAGYIAAVDTVNLHSPQRKYRLAAKGRRLVS